MNIEGKIIRLRAVEPEDAETMYGWENDCAVWPVSGTTSPFSREQMLHFATEQQQADIFRTGQLRLIVEAPRQKQVTTPASVSDLLQDDTQQDDSLQADPLQAITQQDDPPEANPLQANTKQDDPPQDEYLQADLPGAKNAFAAWRAVGAIDLFEFDPICRRAGVGILIHAADDRGRGYAADALQTLCRYAHDTLGMHQLWCNVGADNRASLHLFRSAGFTPIGIKRDWLWTPEGYRDEIMLQKLL